MAKFLVLTLGAALVVACSDPVAPVPVVSIQKSCPSCPLDIDSNVVAVGRSDTLEVQLFDALGDPVAGVAVVWQVVTGTANLVSLGPSDSLGKARAVWTVTAPGRASASASVGSATATFHAMVTRWELRTSLQEELFSHIAIGHGGTYYAVGGRVGGLTGLAHAGISSYDPVTGVRVLRTGDSLARREEHAAVLLGDSIVVLGGIGIGCAGAGPCLVANVSVFDMASGLWSGAASMSSGRYGHTAVVVGRRILVFGGESTGRSAAELDIDANSWRTLPDAPAELRGSAAVAFGADVYVFSRRVDGARQFVSAYRYTTASEQWSAAGELELFDVDWQADLGAVAAGSEVFLFNPTEGAVWRYTPASSSFVEFDHLWRPRTEAPVALVGNTLWVVGGRRYRPSGSLGGMYPHWLEAEALVP